MEIILLKIILCSGVLLGLYHFFLAKERTFIFNRFYLISALIFSLCIPFATIETKQIKEEIPTAIFVEEIGQPILQSPTAVQQERFDFTNILIIIYCIIAVFLVFKIVYSVLKIKRLKGKNLIYQNRKIILLQQDIAPFSFWNTIYLSENYYKNSKIDDTIFLHEEIHIKQKHSADILFVEIVKAVVWFNPFVYFYKKAMVNNHEFIADEGVISQSKDVKNYQELILQEILKQQNIPLIHQFNFNNTKKRFTMMTSKNSQFAKAKKYLAIPVFMTLAITFAEKTYAIQNAETSNLKTSNVISENFFNDPYTEYNQIIKKYGNLLEQKRYAEFHKAVSLADRAKLQELYFKLTKEQRDNTPLFFLNVPKKFDKMRVTQNQIDDFMNSKKYGLWIDGKKTKNQDLKKYKPEDFSHQFVSKRYPKAISAQNPEPYQVNMMTNAYFQKYLNQEEAVHMSFKAKAFIKGKDTIPVKRNTEAKKSEEKKPQDIGYGQEANLIPAEYPGGSNKLRNLVSTNFDASTMNGDEGTLKTEITFIIDKNGKVRDIKATGENEKFNNEATRVIKLANDNVVWKPATIDDEIIAYQYKMPLIMRFESFKKTQ